MSGQEDVWVPITVHLPLGFAKSWSPNKCAPISFICGPYAIIMLAQLGNTVLVPVLPFLVKETGSGAKEYGILQSAMWISQTVLSPLLGALSDSIGRRQVILVSLLISMGGCVILGYSTTFVQMCARLGHECGDTRPHAHTVHTQTRARAGAHTHSHTRVHRPSACVGHAHDSLESH